MANELILIVDDNERNRKLVRDVLAAAGFRIEEASSAGDGVARATKHRPDVILMDIRLPDFDGTEAVRRLRLDARTAAIPVVALTSLAADGDGGWLAGAGMDGVIAKPIDVRTFPDEVRRWCTGRDER